jgi:rod shape-determining protein MreB
MSTVGLQEFAYVVYNPAALGCRSGSTAWAPRLGTRMFHRLRQWLCPDLAIDLGTANTLVAVQGVGIVVDEPSVVALQKGSRKVLGRGTAVGKLAKQMLGRTPDSITAVRPLQDGVITDFELCEAMLRYFIQKAVRRTNGLRPRVIIAVPGSITPVEKRAVFNSAERAGAGRVYLIAESKAAGIGAGLPIAEPMASMVCDIGGGTTDVAIFSLADTVVGKSVRVAGDEMDEAIVEYLKQHYSLRVGTQTAEQLKMEIGSAAPLDQELTAEVRGRDTISGVPRKAIVTSEEIREALRDPLRAILACVKSAIEQCHPDLVADLVDNGLALTGGGALLRGLDVWMTEQLNIPVRVVDDPLTTVARGTAICLEHLGRWKEGLDTGDDL